MGKKSQRSFAAFGAILFLVTSSALTISVIILLIQNSHSSSNTSASATTSSALKQAEAEAKAKAALSSSKPTKLAGTQMSGFTPTTNVPSLESKDLVVGTGAAVQPGATVTVNYTGAVAATGIIFQSSLDSGQPATLSLNQVIEGWTKGIPGMKVGGTRQLLIPAAEAYGANPPSGSGIPANANLVFNVTLEKIN